MLSSKHYDILFTKKTFVYSFAQIIRNIPAAEQIFNL